MEWAKELYKNTEISLKIKKVLFSQQSDYQLVEIFDTHDWGRILMLDKMMMTTETDEFCYHESIAHLPMSLFPAAERVLVIGGGDGGTVRELMKYPSLKEVTMVEIDKMVIDACKEHIPSIAAEFDNPRLKLKVQDASIFIKEAPAESFDLIISDSSDPEGFAATLIEESFYSQVKKALSPKGVFIAQSGSPIAQADELKKTWHNLNTVFEHTECAWSLVPTYPGAMWSFVLASKAPFQKGLSCPTPPNCKLWTPALQSAMLSRPGILKSLLEAA